MKRTLRTFLSLILTLAFVAGLMPLIASADVTEYELWVDGVQVTSENAANILPDGENDGKVFYNATDNILTLNGATVVSPASGDNKLASGIYYQDETKSLTIYIYGNNSISSTSYQYEIAGIYSYAAPSLSIYFLGGSASLDIQGGSSSNWYSYGIYHDGTGTLTVSGAGTLTAHGGWSSEASFGIVSGGDIYIDDSAVVKAYGGNVGVNDDNDRTYGMRCNNLTVGNNSRVEAYSGPASSIDSDGKRFYNAALSISGNITMNGTGSALFKGNENDPSSAGILPDADLYIDAGYYWGGTLICEGSRAAVSKYGDEDHNYSRNYYPNMYGYVNADDVLPQQLYNTSFSVQNDLDTAYKKIFIDHYHNCDYNTGICSKCGKRSLDYTNVSIDNQFYTGNPLEPEVVVTAYDGTPLVNGVDYSVVYSNNVNCGWADVTLLPLEDSAVIRYSSFRIQLSKNDYYAVYDFRDEAVADIAEIDHSFNPADYKAESYAAYKEAYNAFKDSLSYSNENQDTIGAISDARDAVIAAYNALEERTPISEATVAKIAAMKYTGKALTPTPAVIYDGETLVNGTDYKISYKNNKNAGTATVTITGIGDFTGTTSTTFKINKIANPMTAKAKKSSFTVSLSKVTSAAQTVATPITVSKAQGTVTYKKSSGSSNITVDSKTGKLTVKKGTKKGTYTVKVQVKAAGNTNYNAATKTVTLKVIVK